MYCLSLHSLGTFGAGVADQPLGCPQKPCRPPHPSFLVLLRASLATTMNPAIQNLAISLGAMQGRPSLFTRVGHT